MMRFVALEANDFGNRPAPDDPQKALRNHRRKPCSVGGALWQKVATAAAAEATYQPAAERVRAVKAAFATAGLVAKPQRATAMIQQVYDSFSQPVLAGTRSSAMPIRQMLYRAEPYQVDLQIELQLEQNRFVVTGQLVDLSHPEMVGRDVPVTLSDGREYIFNTVTNQFGEFRGEVENSGDLEISFVAPSGKPIVILLRGPLDPSSVAKH
jgi:hypothetical protein